MPVKCTLFFTDRTSEVDDGWTETFYMPQSSATGAKAQFDTNSLQDARRAILSRDFSITRARFVNVTDRTDTLQEGFPGNTGRGTAPNPADASSNSAAVWTAILCRLTAPGAGLRNQAFRGLPQGVIRDSTDFNPVVPAFLTRLNNWLTVLTSNSQGFGAAIRKRNPNPTTTLPTGIAINANGRGLVLTYAPGTVPPFTVGAGQIAPRPPQVFLTGITDINHGNGLWRVQATTNTSMTLYPRRSLMFGTPNLPTKVDVIGYTYPQIASTLVIRGMSRKTGAPSVKLRGRSRARQS